MKSYYGKECTQQTTLKQFKDECPVIVFDCSRSDSMIKASAIDVRLELEFSGNLAADTVGCCLIIHDQVVTYNPFTNIVEKQS